MKKCSICKQKKPESKFHKDKSHKDGLHYQCKPCRAKQRQGKRQKSRKRNRQFELYGLTPKQRLRMYVVDQDGCCAICGEPIPYSKICTDHDHETGKIRGLLCRPCNLNLNVIEKKDWVVKAQEYLLFRG